MLLSDNTTQSTNPTGVNGDGTWVGWPLYDWAHCACKVLWATVLPLGDPWPSGPPPVLVGVGGPFPHMADWGPPVAADYYDLGVGESVELDPWNSPYTASVFATGEGLQIQNDKIRIYGPVKGTLITFFYGVGVSMVFRYGKAPSDFSFVVTPPDGGGDSTGPGFSFGLTGDDLPLTGKD